jgi:hypothetical protein
MNNARFSLQVWSIYLVVVGASLYLIPGTILPILGFPVPVEAYIRVVGALVVVIGYICGRSAWAKIRAFYPWSVQTRWGVALSFVVLVILNIAPVNLLIFALIDFLGGLWTFLALRNETVLAPAASAS